MDSFPGPYNPLAQYTTGNNGPSLQYLDPRRPRSATNPSGYVHPMQMPIPSVPTPGVRPFMPTVQSDPTFQRPMMSVVRLAPPPGPPAVPPHPYSLRHSESVALPPSRTPPPIPPRPAYSKPQPSLPPPVPSSYLKPQPSLPPPVPSHPPGMRYDYHSQAGPQVESYTAPPVRAVSAHAHAPPVHEPVRSSLAVRYHSVHPHPGHPQDPPTHLNAQPAQSLARIQTARPQVQPVHVPETQSRATQPLSPSQVSPLPNPLRHHIPPQSAQAPFPVPLSQPQPQPQPQPPRSESQNVAGNPPAEDDQLAMALALSASESGKRQALLEREDEEFAAVLEMSKIFATGPHAQPNRSDPYGVEAGRSTYADESYVTPTSPPRLQSSVAFPLNPLNGASDDRVSTAPSISITQTTVDQPVASQHETDDGLPGTIVIEPETPQDDIESELPSYIEAVESVRSNAAMNRLATIPSADESSSSQSLAQPSMAPHLSSTSLAPGSSALAGPSATTSNFALAGPSTSTSSFPSTPSLSPRPRTADGFYPDEKRPVVELDTSTSANPPEASVASGLTFVDSDFLRGVSIAFAPPTIRKELMPPQTALPNIILLPYGKCPALHFQAPSWRHLRVLMARLSTTKIEPTLEAFAAAKDELKLRTVIQFVKVDESDWRTIVWFTLDYPVPQSSASWKYTNGDVNTLPYSYTLSPLPALLSEGAEGLNSKWYNVPSKTIPYPNASIDFPDLADYLHAVLEESRRAMHDSSSGMRRLAKMVDLCYPGASEECERSPEMRGMSGLFKRVIGRGRHKKEGRGNEDTYDMVTPFVLDD